MLEFAVESHPNNIPYAEFKKLTGQFKTDFLNELLQNPPEPDRLQSILDSYIDEINTIFLGVADDIPELYDQVNDKAIVYTQILQQQTFPN